MRKPILVITTALVATAIGVPAAATAGSLITSSKIQDGSILTRDLSKGLQAKIDRAAQPGPAGANGLQGARGDNGAPGARGNDGTAGAAGHDGSNGRDGVNAAHIVRESGDHGWSLTGTPGFDSSTMAGGIGIAKSHDAPLSALSYTCSCTSARTSTASSRRPRSTSP